ncbi:glycoside hydrolase family 43 protein, partial [Miniimonas arenae]
WESAPGNPVLTHRSTAHPVQNTGHADLVELADGSWAMVHLGVRPRGRTPQFHVNGRETFVVGIDWVDGWPVVDEGRFAVPRVDTAFEDTFSGDLDLRWVSPGGVHRDLVSAVPGGGVTIAAHADGAAPGGAEGSGDGGGEHVGATDAPRAVRARTRRRVARDGAVRGRRGGGGRLPRHRPLGRAPRPRRACRRGGRRRGSAARAR